MAQIRADEISRLLREEIDNYDSAVNVSEGDLTHGAAEARGFFGTTGAGVKVGVISDGVASLAALQASGDLPDVQVLPGQAGSGNEGSAMLEIVHDLAPEADLAFATANPNEAQLAQNILDLAAAGCNVIVDDVIYLDESPFQDGPVAQAVNSAASAGITPGDVGAIALSGILCGPVFVDEQWRPVRPIIPFLDVRATDEVAWLARDVEPRWISESANHGYGLRLPGAEGRSAPSSGVPRTNSRAARRSGSPRKPLVSARVRSRRNRCQSNR